MSQYPLLDRAENSAALKAMKNEEIAPLCQEIRSLLCETVLQTGGHLASNLGVVELTVALHRVFDLENDHLIFDVGHQCYTHKLLTGRRSRFSTLRSRGGLSGFTKRKESRYDCFGAGHSSTSVSAAIGFAEADRLKGSEAYTVAVLGDGAFTGGMIHEALNNCRHDLRLIIVLNENEMSISRNTGAFAGLIAKIRASKGYYRTKRRTANLIRRLPLVGNSLFCGIRSVKQSIKDKLFKSNYFEDLGLYYLGPIDGNDEEKVERLLREAKEAKQSTVVHIRTTKGKGFAPAEKNPDSYHGVLPAGKEEKRNFSAEVGERLTEMAEKDPRICAVTAAMAGGTGLDTFASAIPNRFFDVGIAEEHALTFCAGLAASGFKPFFAVYSSFLQRGYDNLIHDIALQELPVTVLVDRAGISGGDGPTHHGIFDVSFLSQIPGMTVLTPPTFAALARALDYAGKATTPVAIRYPNGPDHPEWEARFSRRVGAVCADYPADSGCSQVIVTYGRIVSEAIEAARLIHEKTKDTCGILLLEALKPYDRTAEAITALLPKGVKKVLFLEEGIKNGGAGMLLADKLSLPDGCRYTVLAIDDVFDTDRSTGNLYADFGLGREDILAAFDN